MEVPKLTPEFGESQVTALIQAFYQRVRQDDVIGPMYPPEDWDGAEQRLRDFLIFRFGGPDRYIQERGHPRLRMRHAPFKIAAAQRDRWLELMNESILETGLEPSVSKDLKDFFEHVAEFLRNR